MHCADTTTKVIAGQWHNPTLSGIIDVPGPKLDVTGSGTWSGTLIKRGAGTKEVALGPSAVAPSSTLDVQAGSLVLRSDVGATNANLSIRVTGGSATFESTQHLSALDVADHRTATVVADGNRVLATAGLDLHATGKLDLNEQRPARRLRRRERRTAPAPAGQAVPSAINLLGTCWPTW